MEIETALRHLRERFETDKEVRRAYMVLAGEKLKGGSQAAVAKEAWGMCFKEFQEWYDKKKVLLEGMRRFHHAIRGGTDLIDVIESGHWKVDFLHRTVTEKGLDASLAVDMVTLEDNYDVALVVPRQYRIRPKSSIVAPPARSTFATTRWTFSSVNLA